MTNGQQPGQSGQKPPQNQGGPNETKTLIWFMVIALICTCLFNMLIASFSSSTAEEIPYSQFLTMVDDGQVEAVEVEDDRLLIQAKPDQQDQQDTNGFYRQSPSYYYTGLIDDPSLWQRLDDAGVVFGKAVVNNSPILDFIVAWVLPIVLIYVVFSFFMRSMAKRMGGGPLGMGKSNAKVYMQKETGVTFADVAGEEEAKESLMEIVDYLHNTEKYTKVGAKLPKGALLVGPPGTGKTLLAKAVAGEAKVPFYSLTGSDFVEMFVGVGASRVRDLFKQAAENAPCIIFIDEIDAIGKSRDNQLGSNDEREQTLNQLLSEMDGFDPSKGIVVLGATNRPEVLDPALLRPGRFDRRVIVDKPDLKGREEILKVHLKDVKVDSDIDLHKVALATSGGAGADLANIVNEAALRAVRLGRDKVTQEDLMEAVEVIIAGKEKKDRIMNEKERRIVAYHEVGHALAAALQKHSQPVQKITIVPRTMGALGYTMQMPEEERYLMTKEEILDQITTLTAGRAAEEVIFHSVTTGAANDIEQATKLARSMVSQYGMSDTFGMMGLESIQNKYLDGRSVSNCSPQTQAQLDEEVRRIVAEAHQKAIHLLEQHVEALHRIAAFLLEKETITGEEFMAILKEADPDEIRQEGSEAPANESQTSKEASKDIAAAPSGTLSAQEPGKADTADPKEQKEADQNNKGEN